MRKNNYLESIIAPAEPVCVAVFPYSQHFIIKQDLPENAVTNEAEVNRLAGEFIDASGFKTMAGDDIKKPLLKGMLVSALVTYGIIIFLALKLVLR